MRHPSRKVTSRQGHALLHENGSRVDFQVKNTIFTCASHTDTDPFTTQSYPRMPANKQTVQGWLPQIVLYVCALSIMRCKHHHISSCSTDHSEVQRVHTSGGGHNAWLQLAPLPNTLLLLPHVPLKTPGTGVHAALTAGLRQSMQNLKSLTQVQATAEPLCFAPALRVH
jgi:hypothetical protein